MTTCPNGSTYSYTKKKCMKNADFQVYLEQLALNRDVDALQTESNKGQSNVGFDPLGVNTFFDKIGQNIIKILVIGLGLALVVVAGYGYVTGQTVKIELPK